MNPAEVRSWLDQSSEQNQRIYGAILDGPTSLQIEAEKQLESEILQAVTNAKFTKLNLGQIARAYGVGAEVVEAIAQQLTQKYLGADLEQLEFNQVIKQIQEIERLPDAGYREWKLQALARRVHRTPKQLMEVYNKALCQQAPIKPMTVAEFKAAHTREVEWQIQGWIPKGTTVLLHADGGVGKTLFVYEIMECVLQGKSWNGYQVEQGNVLLVQLDEPELVTSERMDIRGISETDPLHILTDWQVEAMANLETYIEQSRPSLVIVDSLTAVNQNCIFSENDTEYARPLLQLKNMASKYGCTVLIIHHSNAEGNSRGTKAIHNSVSEVWGMTVAENSERLLRVQKTRLGRPPGRYTFHFDESDFSFRYLGEQGDENEAASTQEERIRLWLSDDAQRGIAYAPVEIAEHLQMSNPSSRRACYEAWAKGMIQRRKDESGRFYVYFAPLSSDRAIGSIKTPIAPLRSHPNDDIPIVSAESDRAIGENGKNLLLKNGKISDRPIATPQNPSEINGKSAIGGSDRNSKNGDRNSDRTVLIENEPAVNDIVIPFGTATWIRNGSDKLPWKEVPRSRRSDAEIPIEVLGSVLFHELQSPSKVLRVRNERATIRNQQTGRTSVFALKDLQMFRRAE
jgi:KaiC/GvpD/RAD55 family RecA-like ATPase